jgi:hypothetical protein
MPDLTGQTLLRRYRVDTFLGRGGMAEVYRAWDTKRSVHVALKVLNEDLAADYVFLNRFTREARALEMLQHPHTVRFFGFEEADDLAFLVLEYIDGWTLRRQLKLLGRPLTLSEALGVLHPVCSALHYAHQMGVLHCDIKPANIFIERGGRVVLGDFGISRLTESATVTFSTPGTPAYMAPEQCRGEEISARTDVYGLGITTFEMLTLDRPFKGLTEATTGSVGERVRWEQVHLPPPQPSIVNPQITSETDAAILKALEKKPEQRQQSAQELYSDLSRTGRIKAAAAVPWVEKQQGTSPAASATTAAAPPVTQAQRPMGLLVVLGGIVALLVAVVLFALLTPRETDEKDTDSVATIAAQLTVDARTAAARATSDAGTAVARVTLDAKTAVARTTLDARTAATQATSDARTAVARATLDQPATTPSLSPTRTRTPTVGPTHTPTPRYPSDLRGRIVFTRKSTPWSNDTSEIWVLDLDTDSLLQLTHNNAVDWIPTWSGDGSRIAFTSNREGNYDLWVMNADGNDQRPWITLPAWDEYARWSPEGAWLAFASTGETEGTPNSEIFVAASNANLRRVTFNTGRDEWPTWSPDGRWLACSSDRDGDMDVYVFSAADGGSILNWTADTAFNEQPAWSPDGEWIAFIRKAQTAPGQQVFWGDVWIGRRDQSEFRRLTQDGLATEPAWSPDGRYIVFGHYWDSTDDGEITLEDASDLWAIRVENGEPFAITEGIEKDYAPQWTR